jgi:hypothetical protein
LHFIVSTYYSTYKAVIKLLLPSTEIVPLLSYKVKNKKSHYSPVVFDEKTSLFVPSELKQEGQQLILIPDLWTGYNMFDDTVLDQSTIRYSGLTALQMTKIFR